MSRLLEVSKTEKPKYELVLPLYYRLDTVSLSNLQYAQWKNHRKKLKPPDKQMEIIEFDAAAEMVKKPKYEREALK